MWCLDSQLMDLHHSIIARLPAGLWLCTIITSYLTDSFTRITYSPWVLFPGQTSLTTSIHFYGLWYKNPSKFPLVFPAIDAYTSQVFCLWVYFILAFSDMPMMLIVMHMKGPRAVMPCCFCKICCIWIPNTNSNKAYYMPLDCSCHPDVSTSNDIISNYSPIALSLLWQQWSPSLHCDNDGHIGSP
jgi:hypothetical protein